MKTHLIRFGLLEIDGERYDYDVLIKGGKIKKRKKGPSHQYKEQFGHTPLSDGEKLPLKGKKLIIGTGLFGALPVMDGVFDLAAEQGVEVVAVKTPDACKLINEMLDEEVHAILHITC